MKEIKFHKAKKSLGQNFLKSEKILNEIVKAGEIDKQDIILEIGPGKGSLTSKLLEKADKVIAVEKDNYLFEFLKEKFRKEITNGSLVLVHGDVVDFKPKEYNLETNNYKILANIPYNITGLILKKFLTEETTPSLMILMLQYEVVKRIISNNKKESILSISVKAYGSPKMITKVPARYFSPKPKVDSAILKIDNMSKNLFLKSNFNSPNSSLQIENDFWSLIHRGFAHKRKKLGTNLKNFPKVNKTILEKYKEKRAEDLDIKSWFEFFI